MINELRAFIRKLFTIFLLLLPGELPAAESQCFRNVRDYLLSTYGEEYVNDENIIISKEQFGSVFFTIVQDITSGTNHSFTLIREYSDRACVLLITSPVASLVASAYDTSGFPVSLTSIDQASPGEPSHEITYVFDPDQRMYIVSSCRALRYKGSRSYRTSVDCNRILDN